MIELLHANVIMFTAGVLVSVVVAIWILPETADTGASDPRISAYTATVV